MARRTCRAGKIGVSFDGDICTHAGWPTRSTPEGGVTTTTFLIMQSLRLDSGPSRRVHP
jgi:hypothetical protein